MRLWHYKLIPVLPRQQLLGQWRELNLIAKSLHDKGTPNHLLVNPILDYPVEEFLGYCKLVETEMHKRGYTADIMQIYEKLFDDIPLSWNICINEDFEFFEGWHTDRYFDQCYYNLEEKYDRGGIMEDEFAPILLLRIGTIRNRE